MRFTKLEKRTEKIQQRRAEDFQAFTNSKDWFPACGGTEIPFTSRSGKRLLYVWQPSTGNHAYLDLDSDIVLSDEDARQALGTY